MTVLQLYRIEKKITIAELSRRSGLTREAIYKIERLKRKPRLDTLGKLALGLDVDISELTERFEKESFL